MPCPYAYCSLLTVSGVVADFAMRSLSGRVLRWADCVRYNVELAFAFCSLILGQAVAFCSLTVGREADAIPYSRIGMRRTQSEGLHGIFLLLAELTGEQLAKVGRSSIVLSWSVTTRHIVTTNKVEHLVMRERVTLDQIVTPAACLAIALHVPSLVISAVNARFAFSIIYNVNAGLGHDVKPLPERDVHLQTTSHCRRTPCPELGFGVASLVC